MKSSNILYRQNGNTDYKQFALFTERVNKQTANKYSK